MIIKKDGDRVIALRGYADIGQVVKDDIELPSRCVYSHGGKGSLIRITENVPAGARIVVSRTISGQMMPDGIGSGDSMIRLAPIPDEDGFWGVSQSGKVSLTESYVNFSL